MVAFASSSSAAVIPAIIGAIGSIVAALLVAVVAFRAQSAKQQLEAIRQIIEEELRETLDAQTRGLIIAEIVKRALREVLGSRYGGRRWYDENPDD